VAATAGEVARRSSRVDLAIGRELVTKDDPPLPYGLLVVSRAYPAHVASEAGSESEGQPEGGQKSVQLVPASTGCYPAGCFYCSLYLSAALRPFYALVAMSRLKTWFFATSSRSPFAPIRLPA
jgi:hypothetical protein